MEYVNAILLVVLSGCLAAFGKYLYSYMKKKGENQASKEDIAELVTQMSAITTATESIKASISHDVWERQRRWEIKRDAIFETMRELAALDDKLEKLFQVCADTAGEAGQGVETLHRNAQKAYRNAFDGFSRSCMATEVICKQSVGDALIRVSKSAAALGRVLEDGGSEAVNELSRNFRDEIRALQELIRDELNIKETPDRPQSGLT